MGPPLGIAIGIAFGLFAWRMRYLTASGAVAGGLFAATLIALGGWGWMVPGFTFFLLSSAISKGVEKARGGRDADGGSGSRRDAVQVAANGGVAWVLLVAHAMAPHPGLYWAFVGSFAAAAADTWATEIGPLFRQRPRMILGGHPVPPGTSGGVTLAGTLVGVSGAGVIWASAWWSAPEELRRAGLLLTLVAVVAGGAVGSLVDSLAGATIQAVYRDPTDGRLVDGRRGVGIGRTRVRGWAPVDNDVVNGLCTLAGAVVTAGMLVLG